MGNGRAIADIQKGVSTCGNEAVRRDEAAHPGQKTLGEETFLEASKG